MYYIINITKWSNFTEHYYANIYNFSALSSMDGIIDGVIELDVAKKLSNIYPTLYPTIKNVSEKSVINEAANMIIDNKQGLSAWMCVFYNGKYSKHRTLAIDNDKAVLMLKNRYKEIICAVIKN